MPGEYPRNVSATASTSTSALVTWEKLPEASRHGVITHYEVQYEPLVSVGGLVLGGAVSTEDGSQLTLSVTELEEDMEYNVTVRAHTAVGGGPSSPVVTVRTFEDSKKHLMLNIL